MANELVASIPAAALVRKNGLTNDHALVFSGDTPCVRLPKSDDTGYFTTFTLGEVGALAANFTVRAIVTDDGTDSNDLGKDVQLGVTLKLLADGETGSIATSGGTEVETTATLDATSGEFELATFSTVGLDSMTEPTVGLLRVRRLGSESEDTCVGCALLAHVYIVNN